jgi:transitional endoplasmic reticulum ATPase
VVLADVSSSVLATLLTELDGVQSADGVIVIAASNRPDTLDPALVRPGRLEVHLCVPNPDTRARADILRLHMSRLCVHPSVSAFNNSLAELTHGWSGAELENLCREAAMACLRGTFGESESRLGSEALITQSHLKSAFFALADSKLSSLALDAWKDTLKCM